MSIPSGIPMKTSVSMSPFRKAVIMSKFLNCQPLKTDMATSNLKVASDAVGAYVSMKSTP